MLERVLFAGGGTGGHIFMAVALARELEEKAPHVDLLFVSTERGIGKELIPSLGFKLETIKIGGLKGASWWRRATTLVQLPRSLLASHRIVRRFSPSIIVGLGGYSSGPVMLAGGTLGVPLLLIEPNVQLGLTNRLLAQWVDGAAVAFEETLQQFGAKGRLTGVPVRKEFHHIPAGIATSGPLRLLVLGGSQGSLPINRLVSEALPFLPAEKFHIVHQTGPNDASDLKRTYLETGIEAEVVEFIQDMPSYFSRADLIISRAGASTLAEMTVAGRPAVLIPLPHAADDHQRINAEALARRKAALVLEQEKTTGQELAELLLDLERDRQRVVEMARASRKTASPESRQRILEFMEELA